MRKILSLVLVISMVIFIACSSNTKKALMPGLNTSDSASVLYYDSANNPRFFKFTKVKAPGSLSPVISDVNNKTIKERNDCATQGKIYFYAKKGVVHTVYFNYLEGCMTFSFIITGEKYFARMSEGSAKLLKELKLLAKEPVKADQ